MPVRAICIGRWWIQGEGGRSRHHVVDAAELKFGMVHPVVQFLATLETSGEAFKFSHAIGNQSTVGTLVGILSGQRTALKREVMKRGLTRNPQFRASAPPLHAMRLNPVRPFASAYMGHEVREFMAQRPGDLLQPQLMKPGIEFNAHCADAGSARRGLEPPIPEYFHVAGARENAQVYQPFVRLLSEHDVQPGDGWKRHSIQDVVGTTIRFKGVVLGGAHVEKRTHVESRQVRGVLESI